MAEIDDNLNPFEDVPNRFERYLYGVQESHAIILMNMHKELQLVKAMFNEIKKLNETTNKQILSMPVPSKDEKVN